MRDDPCLDPDTICACLDAQYDLRIASVSFLPLGYDPNTAVYEAVSRDGDSYFLKVRFGPVDETGLLVPRALIDLGVPNVLAPLHTRSGDLWCPLDGHAENTVVLYPFIRGVSAKDTGLSDDQWRQFGSTLRAVHTCVIEERLRGRLPVETFALPSAALVRRLLEVSDGERVESAAAKRFAAFLGVHDAPIREMLARAEALGVRLRSRSFELVLCHADIHAANILVGEAGRIWLIDWDAPLIAPRERDLLFVVGSRIARAVTPEEERLFFAGYGAVKIDTEALMFFRYERIVEDLGEIGRTVLLDPRLGEQTRVGEAELAMSFLAPGGDVDRAESVAPTRL